MRKTVQLLFLLSLFYFGASQTFAQCSCLPKYRDLTPHKEFKLADAVFIGKVIEITKTDGDKKTGRYVETVKFEVKKAWKQDLDAFVIIQNKIGGCINGFDENEEWLVYAYKQQDGTFASHCCCSQTRLFANAAKDLKEFEANGELPTKIRPPR